MPSRVTLEQICASSFHTQSAIVAAHPVSASHRLFTQTAGHCFPGNVKSFQLTQSHLRLGSYASAVGLLDSTADGAAAACGTCLGSAGALLPAGTT